MLHCKFSGDYSSERIFKIGQCLTKLCVEHLGFTFFGPPYIAQAMLIVFFVHTIGPLGLHIPDVFNIRVMSSNVSREPLLVTLSVQKGHFHPRSEGGIVFSRVRL